MAEVDDVTLILLNEENVFLREKFENLEKKYNSIIKKETVLKNTVQELQKQRNEAETNYNRLQKEHAVSYIALADKRKETEKKLQEICIKYETEVRTKTETEVISLQKKVIMVQDELNKTHKELNKTYKELNKTHKELNKTHKELNKAQIEIINTQKEIINLYKELNNLRKQLYEKADQIRIIQAEQKEREEKLKGSFETQMINNQMVRMKAALTTFEKQKIPDFDPNKRGELWNDKYLKTNYKNVTLPPNIKSCVRSIFDKLNKNVQLRNWNLGQNCLFCNVSSKTTFALIILFFTLVMFLSFGLL